MEIFRMITSWFYPVADLALMIVCLVVIKNLAGKLLAGGFAALLVSSMTWRIFELLRLYERGEHIYSYIGIINFLLYLTFVILFIFGILNIAKSYNSLPEKNERTGTPHHFGNVSLFIVPLIIGVLLIVVGTLLAINEDEEPAIILLFIGAIVLIFAGVYFLIVLYRVWKFAIDQSHQHNLTPSIQTPGKAVGFLFIPIFNFYWVFLAYGKLPKDLLAVASAKGQQVDISESIGTAIAILALLGIIPVVGYITALVNLVLQPIFLSQAINASEVLSASVATAPAD